MQFQLPKLNYNLDGLSPYFSKETLSYHYEKHHQTYVDNLNKLIVGTEFENLSLDEIIKKSVSGPIFNNSAQVWNHNFYFEQFSKNAEVMPNLPLLDQIIENFGNFEKFREDFNKSALSNFGSGWTWLIYDKNTKELKIVNTSNAANFVGDEKFTPLLVCDVWEHAYYIDYRNNRAKYLDNFWKILDWKVIEARV